MLPLAVAGTIFIGAAVLLAAVVLWVLLRMEASTRGAQEADEEALETNADA